MNKLRLIPPEDAPKNGATILADFGWGRLVPAIWSELDEEWKIANVHTEKIEDENSNESRLSRYYENECEDHANLKGWLEIPTNWLFTTKNQNND
jgi:hypothetical protein